MRTLRLVLAAAAVFAFPLSAQARFGKAGSPTHGSDSSAQSSSQTHPARPAGSHGATSSGPVYAPGYYPSGYGYWHPGWYAWGFGYTPIWLAPQEAPGPQPVQQATNVASTLEFHGQAVLGSHSTPGGGAAGLMFSIEGPQLGLMVESNSMVLQADDFSGTTDTLHLADAHLTFAVLSSPYGRLRVEGGLDAALAPDISFFGPGGGVSGVVGLFGTTSLEAALRVTPYPFTKVDWNVGLSFGLGTMALRAGWRETFLDDQGRVDGASHQDLLYGPYVGLALAI